MPEKHYCALLSLFVLLWDFLMLIDEALKRIGYMQGSPFHMEGRGRAIKTLTA
jgi:hypothetical protein